MQVQTDRQPATAIVATAKKWLNAQQAQWQRRQWQQGRRKDIRADNIKSQTQNLEATVTDWRRIDGGYMAIFTEVDQTTRRGAVIVVLIAEVVAGKTEVDSRPPSLYLSSFVSLRIPLSYLVSLSDRLIYLSGLRIESPK